MAKELTDEIIRKEQAPEKGTKTLWDGGKKGVAGFGVRIYAPSKSKPNGSRSFFLNYRVDGVERRYTIGDFPTWTAKDARDEAKALRQRIDRGEDPAAEKRKRREAPTIQNLLDRYIEDHLPSKACYGTWRERDERKMLDLIGDGLGRKSKVSDIHSADIKKLHRAITKANGPFRANRTIEIASKCFSMAMTLLSGEREPWRSPSLGNPCKGVKRNTEDGRERFFDEAEIAAIGEALDMADERSSADCIRIVMLTGCRPCEAMRARWEEFDRESGFWVKPSAHTKQNKVHKAPLNAAACQLIEGLRETRKGDSPFVFPGRNPGEPVKHIRTIWRTARKRANVLLWLNSEDPKVSGLLSSLMEQAGRLPSIEEAKAAAAIAKVPLPDSLENARIYDLRHTFASYGAGASLGLPIIGKLLGHTKPRTTQRYAHLADATMREAAENIGKLIASAVSSVERRKASRHGAG
jgi:integrase